MKLSELKSNPNNPRTITKAQVEKLKESIKKFPKMMELRPIIHDKDGIVLGGNMRLHVLGLLGYEDLPEGWTKCADDLTEDEKREFIIKDNVGFGSWDFEELANIYSIEELEAWGMEHLSVW